MPILCNHNVFTLSVRIKSWYFQIKRNRKYFNSFIPDMILNLPMIKTTVRMDCHPKTNKQKYHIINHIFRDVAIWNGGQQLGSPRVEILIWLISTVIIDAAKCFECHWHGQTLARSPSGVLLWIIPSSYSLSQDIYALFVLASLLMYEVWS